MSIKELWRLRIFWLKQNYIKIGFSYSKVFKPYVYNIHIWKRRISWWVI